MTQFKGFETKQEAKEYQREHGGYLVWDERTPKRKAKTARGKEYWFCVNLGGLDDRKYPYCLTWANR